MLFKIILLCALFNAVVVLVGTQTFDYAQQGANWTTAGWRCLAPTSTKQSPVALPTATSGAPPADALTVQSIKGYSSFTVAQMLDKSIKITPVGGVADKILLGTTTYNLDHYDIHAPAEHLLDGVRAAAEIQMTFKSSEGTYAVMSFLYDTHDKLKQPAQPVLAFSAINENNALRNNVEYSAVSTDTRYDIFDSAIRAAENQKAKAWYYEGSFTQPPCTEEVKWIVLDKIVAIDTNVLNGVVEKLRYPKSLGNYRVIDSALHSLQGGITLQQYDSYTWEHTSNTAPHSRVFMTVMGCILLSIL